MSPVEEAYWHGFQDGMDTGERLAARIRSHDPAPPEATTPTYVPELGDVRSSISPPVVLEWYEQVTGTSEEL